MRKRLADVLRTAAVVYVNLAEKLDPQPEISGVWPFEVHTASGTTGCEARVTWHHKFHETA